jgi:transcriptional regulator with XRE-family HTH domain
MSAGVVARITETLHLTSRTPVITFKVEEKMKKSLIQEFIESWLADYQEPEHAGTARGDPVGFSRKKMQAAALMALTGKTERELASELGISESLLRKWYCDDKSAPSSGKSFKAVMRRFVSEFRRYFAAQMQQESSAGAKSSPFGELLSPAAEYEVYSEVVAALEGGRTVEWFQAALRHTAPMLSEKLRTPHKKWIYNRAPHDESIMLWRLEKMSQARGPLEETVRLLRERLYAEAEEMLKREHLDTVLAAQIRSLLGDLRMSEEVLQRSDAP